MADTPFDNTVTITWNVDNPINGILALHTGLSQLDRDLDSNTAHAGSFAIDFQKRIGLVHDAFLEVIGDIRDMQAAMDKAAASPQAPAGSSSGLMNRMGAVTNYRMPDAAPYGAPGKPSGMNEDDWALVQRQLMGGGGISPTVLATSQMRMSLAQGFGGNGGYDPADPFRNASGGITPTDQLRAAQAAVARQDYDQYQRIAALSPNAGNYDAMRQQAGTEQAANFDAQRVEYQNEYNEGVRQELALREATIALARSEYTAGARHEVLMQQAGLTSTFDESIDPLRAQAQADQDANIAAQRAAGQQDYSDAARYQQLQQKAGLGGTFDEGIDAMRSGAEADRLTNISDAAKEGRQEYDDYVAAQRRVQAATQDTSQAEEDNANGLEKMGGSILRHIGYIGQAILIWGAWQQAQAWIKQAIQDMQALEDVSARVAYVNGQSLGATGAQLATASQYGVGIANAAPGLLTASQFGASAADRNNAGQLAEIFGADQYNQALTELMQTERRASDTGLEHVSVMNYIATAYQEVPGDMKTYFDALQLGITLHTELGLTAEQTGLMLLKASSALGESPDQIANVLERVQLRLANTGVQQQLATGYGIKGTDPTDLLKQVSARVAADPSGSQGLMTFLTQGLGIQGPRTLLDMTTALVEFNKAATESAQPLSNINDLTKNIDTTGTQAFNHLKAAADAFLASLIQIEGQKSSLQVIMDLLNPSLAPGAAYQIAKTDASKMGDVLQNQANLNSYQLATGKSPYSLPNTSGGPTGAAGLLTSFGLGDLAGLLTPLFGGLEKAMTALHPELSQFTPDYLSWLAQQNGNSTGGSPGVYDRGIPDNSMLKALPSDTSVTPSQFGGFQDLPKNFNWDKFTADLKKYSDQLTKQVPDYVQNPQEVAFWDASQGYYRTANADSQVIQRALQDQADALKQITGVFNVPSTGDVMVPFFALQSGMVPSNYPGLAGSKASRAQGALNGQPQMTNEERNKSLGIDPNYRPEFTDPAQYGVMDYLKAHGYSPSATAAGKQTGTQPGMMDDSRSESIQQHRDAMTPVVNISLRNQVVLNSRVIYDEIRQDMEAQLSTTRRGVGGGAGSQYLIG